MSRIPFSVRNHRYYREIPLDQVDELPHSVYIIDYNWVYLFVNKNCKRAFGSLGENLVGQNALEKFADPKFQAIFDEITYSVKNKLPLDKILFSPLRTSQVRLTGFPLEDCYYFSSIPIPDKDDVLKELRDQLKKKKT